MLYRLSKRSRVAESVLGDTERAQLLHYSFLFFNAADISHTRTLVEESRKFIQLIRRPDGIDVNTTVIFVAHPAAQTDTICVLLHEPTESDPLHTAGDEPAARLDRGSAQFLGSATPTDSSSA